MPVMHKNTRAMGATTVHASHHGLAMVVAAQPLSFAFLDASFGIFENCGISHGLFVFGHFGLLYFFDPQGLKINFYSHALDYKL